MSRPTPEDIGRWVEDACVLDVLAPKPGNVHFGAAFADCDAQDFIASAQAVRRVFEQSGERTVGETVLAAVRATRARVGKNTNLGIVLLLAPLARAAASDDAWIAGPPDGAPPVTRLQDAVRDVLDATTRDDAELVYEAIRLARPGGLGEADAGDVQTGPTGPLLEMMALAAARDSVARQYADGFRGVLEDGLQSLGRWSRAEYPAAIAVVGCYLDLLSTWPDSLVARKAGPDAAETLRTRACEIRQAGWPDAPASWNRLRQLDAELREAAGRLNPGTTADLTVASLFAGRWAGIL